LTAAGGLRLGEGGFLYALQCQQAAEFAKLSPRDTELMELFHREGMEVDFALHQSSIAGASRGPNASCVQAILYGQRYLTSSVKELLNDLEYFLQDPSRPVRDTPYFNPQRLFNVSGARTSDLSHSTQLSVQGEKISVADILTKFTSSGTLSHTEGSLLLSTPLHG
jgi:hypothetical protein